MTDTKTPERIWAWDVSDTDRDNRPYTTNDWDDEPPSHPMDHAYVPVTEYVHADIHDTLTKQRDELAADLDHMKENRDRWMDAAQKAEAERDAALARAGAAAVEMRERALVAVSKSDSQEMDICGAAAIAIRIATLPIPTDAQAALDKLIADARADAARVKNGVLPLDEWHEDIGYCVWWWWTGDGWAGEPAWIGSPTCSDWPGYHTHFTPHPAFPNRINEPQEGGE